MNICLVSRELYPFQKAGIGVYVHNLTKSLAKNDHRIFIITSKSNQVECDQGEYYQEPNINIIGVEEESLIIGDFSLAYSLGVYHQLKRLTTKEEISLIEFADYFGEGFYSLLYKRVRGEFRNIPFVVKLHTPTYECNIANQLGEPENRLTFQEDFVIRNVEYIYSISYFMKDTITTRLNRKDIDVVYNMIGTPSPYSVESGDDLLQQSKFILYVGRLEERKGIDIFIRAALQIIDENDTDVNFIVIGRDILNQKSNRMMKEELLELIPSNLQHRFSWKAPMAQEELMNYYQHAYVSVFPSRFEGFGNVCVEAMRMGSPVIVSNNTALVEIIGKEYGVSFINGDYLDLYNKINYLLKNEHYRDKLSNLSKERSNYFSIDYLYPNQIEYYEKIINHFKSAPQKISKEIQEIIMLENIDRIHYLFQENSRVTQQKIIDYTKLDEENNRLIGEWGKNKEYIELLRDQILKMEQENKRVLNEWEKLVSKNNETTRHYENQLDVLRGNEQLLIEKMNKQIHELRNLKEQIDNFKITLVDKQTQIAELTQKNDEKHQIIDEMKQQMRSRRFLIKQIMSRKREY
ncbi:glycosyltransferase [Paenibacillus apiarius]|uniref:glycosyltransferase n=1 Tax=Paenibacillus apiarius TaxID=46240 RepID=UPI003B3A5E5B